MSAYEIVVLGPEGAPREELVWSLRRLGHAVQSASLGSEPAANGRKVDVVVVDARDEQPDWAALGADRRAAGRPMLVLSDGPDASLGTLRERRGGFVLLVGPQSETGYQTALCICAALSSAELQPRGS